MRDDATANVLTVLQVTDPHLFADGSGTLLGVNTEASLRSVLGAARSASCAPDLVLATGDISQDGTPGGYSRFCRILREHFDAPLYWLPGNHDLLQPMVDLADADSSVADSVSATLANDRVVDTAAGWRLVLLDTHIEHQVPGKLGPAQLELLAAALKDLGDRPLLVALHHHVLPVGASWLDSQRVSDGDRFRDLLAGHKGPRAVVFGHVHQAIDEVVDGVRYLASPATCFQFLPRFDDFGLDRVGPGCRWLQLHGNGRLDTWVQRVPLTRQLMPDLGATGY